MDSGINASDSQGAVFVRCPYCTITWMAMYRFFLFVSRQFALSRPSSTRAYQPQRKISSRIVMRRATQHVWETMSS